MNKAVVDRANLLVPLACEEVEDENDDGTIGEVEERELGPTIAGIVCIKAINWVSIATTRTSISFGGRRAEATSSLRVSEGSSLCLL